MLCGFYFMNKQVYISFKQKRRVKRTGNIEATMSQEQLAKNSKLQIDLI